MNEPPDELLLEMYVRMVRVRLFEERVRALFANARIPGFLPTHRGHGHLVAKGGSRGRAAT